MNCRGKITKNDDGGWTTELCSGILGGGTLKICNEKVPVICLNEGNFKSEFSVPGYVFNKEAIRDKSLASIMVRVDLPQCEIPLYTVEGVHYCKAILT